MQSYSGPVAQRLEQGTHNSRQILALVFTVSHSVADARYFGNPIFAARCIELRIFAAKFRPTVEQTVEKSLGDTKPSAVSTRSAMSPRGLLCAPSSMQSMRAFGNADHPVLGHAKFTSNSRKKHDHRARLGTVSMAGNRLCRLPLDDVVRGVQGCVNPAPPLIFA